MNIHTPITVTEEERDVEIGMEAWRHARNDDFIREWRSAQQERMETINVITTTVIFAVVGLGIGFSAGIMLYN